MSVSSSPRRAGRSAPSGTCTPCAQGIVVWGLGTPAPLEHALGFLAAEDTVAAIPCSRFWESIAASDAVWAGKCQELWADKVYVPKCFRASGEGSMSRCAAYWGSLEDARRDFITVEELCSFEWCIRMKGWSGPDWTNNDPWWQDRPAATRRYTEGGTVLTSNRAESGGWRFVPDSCGRKGPEGCFVRHSRGNRDYPTHFVSRWPRNWGWILQNCWGFSTSFPMPPRGGEAELEDDGDLCQSVTVDMCRDEAMRFNMGLPLPHEGPDSSGGFITVLVNGIERQLSAAVVAELVSAHQRQNEGIDGEAESSSQYSAAEGEAEHSPAEESA